MFPTYFIGFVLTSRFLFGNLVGKENRVLGRKTHFYNPALMEDILDLSFDLLI